MPLKLGLVSFWGLWHAVVFLSNFCEGLKRLRILPIQWTFASQNYAAIEQATGKYHPPRGLLGALFAAILLWQLFIVMSFAWVLIGAMQTGELDSDRVQFAFTLSLGLLAAFLLADEVCLEYETEHGHILIFIAQLLTFVGLFVIPSSP